MCQLCAVTAEETDKTVKLKNCKPSHTKDSLHVSI